VRDQGLDTRLDPGMSESTSLSSLLMLYFSSHWEEAWPAALGFVFYQRTELALPELVLV